MPQLHSRPPSGAASAAETYMSSTGQPLTPQVRGLPIVVRPLRRHGHHVRQRVGPSPRVAHCRTDHGRAGVSQCVHLLLWVQPVVWRWQGALPTRAEPSA